MQIEGLDEIDNRILSVIRDNARLSYKDIGEQVGISRVSVKTRMDTMQEKGIMLQVTEVGSFFYIDWYQGFHKEDYVKALRDVLEEKGVGGITIERVE